MADVLARLQGALQDRYRFERELGEGGMAFSLCTRLGVGLLLLVAAAGPALAQCPDGTPPPCPGATVRTPSVAVLFMESRSRNAADSLLAEGLTGGRPLFGYGIALARAGRLVEARAVLRALEVRSQDHYVPPTMLAGVRAALGDADGAFREPGRAFEVHDGLVLGLDLWPWLDPLRSDLRFAALRRRMSQP